MQDTKATKTAISDLKKKFPKLTYTPVSDTGLMISDIGFGTYRVSVDQEHHKDALKEALRNGVNLIDTSTNYMNGDAEKCVRAVLNDLIESHEVRRDQVVLVSKAGYIQGDLLETVKKDLGSGKKYPELTMVNEDLGHSIHPEFINSQIIASSNRLGVNTIDIFLLHNPEYYFYGLEDATSNKVQEEFYKRIRAAFLMLESQVKEGAIQCYGVSANTFIEKRDHKEFISLSKLISIAEEISPDHHFKVVQCPFNVLESNAVLEPNNDGDKTFLETAEKHNLCVLANRPLNAVENNTLIRLADFHLDQGISNIEIEDMISELKIIESNFDQFELDSLDLEKDDEEKIKPVFMMGHELESLWPNFHSLEHCKDAVSYYVLQRLELVIGFLSENTTLKLHQKQWLEMYLNLVNDLVKGIILYYKLDASYLSEKVRYQLEKTIPRLTNLLYLSQMAVHAIRSTKGVSSVLVGMRQESYVQEMLTLAEKKPVDISKDTWRQLHEKLHAL